jgi:hypothetical protein
MAENKGRPGGKLGIAKTERRRAFSKTRQTDPEPVTGKEARERRATRLHPGGHGGRFQQAGGPDHHGLEGDEDRNL